MQTDIGVLLRPRGRRLRGFDRAGAWYVFSRGRSPLGQPDQYSRIDIV